MNLKNRLRCKNAMSAVSKSGPGMLIVSVALKSVINVPKLEQTYYFFVIKSKHKRLLETLLVFLLYCIFNLLKEL